VSPHACEDAAVSATVILLGPPGCGKGTQAARLRDRSGFTLVATGDLLREARAAGTGLGREAAAFMDRGVLVPDEVILAMVAEAVAALDAQPVVLDGVPRTVPQAMRIDALVRAHARELTAAVLIDVPDDEVVRRIAGRRQGRSDDTPETARERLRVYHRETEPLIRHYEAQGLLRRVDGAQDADSVEDGVRAALE
jgi:adenylate kinase